MKFSVKRPRNIIGVLSLVFTTLLLQQTAKAQDTSSCFNGRLPYFQNVQRMSGTAEQKMLTLENGCNELAEDGLMESPGIGGRIAATIGEGLSFPAMGQALAAFSSLNGSEGQRAYRAQLERIRQVRNPMDRIRQVYELAARQQGFYDHEGMNSVRYNTPGRIIDRSNSSGTAGVCRDFAALLHWSLLQVSRHPSSNGMALAPTDFSADIVTGFLPGGGHAWVRVNLPNHNAQGMITGFNRFDIDTTWFPNQFSVLFPRQSGVSAANRTRLQRECREVRACLRGAIPANVWRSSSGSDIKNSVTPSTGIGGSLRPPQPTSRGSDGSRGNVQPRRSAPAAR